ncbi:MULTISPECIES: hypothetical protein [Bacillus]
MELVEYARATIRDQDLGLQFETVETFGCTKYSLKSRIERLKET